MKIAVLGNGPVKRKQVTEAIKHVFEDDDTTLLLPEGDEDTWPDATRFAADWFDMYTTRVDTPVDAAKDADVVLVAWDDAQVDEIEQWVKATQGRVLDLTNDLAEITLEGEPDEAQQPSDEKAVSGKPVGDALVAVLPELDGNAEDAELAAAVRVIMKHYAKVTQ